MRVYSLFDRKVREYGGLVLSPNDETAERALQEGIPAQSTVGKYPEDYDLYYLGEFDASKGLLVGCGIPEFVENVRVVLEKKRIQDEGAFAEFPKVVGGDR